MPYPLKTGIGLGLGLRNTGLAMGSNTSRYFRRNLGTIDYAQLSAPVVLSADYDIKITSQLPAAGGYFLAKKASTDSTMRFGLTNAAQFFGIIDGGGTIGPAHSADPLDLNVILIQKRGSVVEVFVNGSSIGTGTSTQPFEFDSFYSPYAGSTSTGYLTGVMADIEVISAGTLIHFWAIDDDSNTLVDSIGGNNATVINGLASDWGLFTEQNNGDWLGVNMWTVGDAVADGTEASFETVLDGGSVLTANATYRTECVMSGRTKGNMQFRYGVSAGQLMASNQKFTEEVVSSAAGVICRVGNSVVNAGATVSSISMREVLKIA